MTVSDLSESALIARVTRRLPPAPPWLAVGIGDDAAVVEPERNRVDVLTVDALVDGVHFDRRFTPPDAIGHRALAVNLSDLAAMGAAPRLALLSFALPGDLPVDDFDGILDGLTALAAVHRVTIAGGNLTRTPGPLTLDVTAIGTAKRRGVLTRAGARPGDELYVTGTIGSAAAGLQMLKSGLATGEHLDRPEPRVPSPEPRVPSPESRFAAPEPPAPSPESRFADPEPPAPSLQPRTDAALIEAYLRPDPRVRAGVLLGRNRAASACVDLSDGLADAAHRIAEASGVGVSLDADAIPIAPAARAWFAARGEEPVLAASAGGDDYELLFAVRPRARRTLEAVRRHGGVPVTRVGVCTDNQRVVLTRGAESRDLPRGYEHFGRGERAARGDAR